MGNSRTAEKKILWLNTLKQSFLSLALLTFWEGESGAVLYCRELSYALQVYQHPNLYPLTPPPHPAVTTGNISRQAEGKKTAKWEHPELAPSPAHTRAAATSGATLPENDLRPHITALEGCNYKDKAASERERGTKTL